MGLAPEPQKLHCPHWKWKYASASLLRKDFNIEVYWTVTLTNIVGVVLFERVYRYFSTIKLHILYWNYANQIVN